MAQGSIKKRSLDDGSVRYDVVVDLGMDPVTGKRRQRKKTFRTKREAQSGLTAWLGEIDKGTAVDRSRQTVAEMLEFWLETYARHHVRPRSLCDYEHTIRRHIVPYLGAVPAQKLTADQLQKFYNNRLLAGCGPRTVHMCHQRMHQALKQAIRLGLLTRNVAELVTPPRITPREMTTWTPEQARRFLTVAVQSGYGPIWIVSLATGMRRGELLGLRWQDVDIEAGILSVRQTVGTLNGAPEIKPPKSKSSRRDVPVQREVITVLKEHRARQNERRLALGAAWRDHDLVFCTNVGTPINPNNLARDYLHWVELASVPRIRIHDQRHTHVTMALKAGANIKAVSQRVGHARTSITLDIYAHVLPEQRQEVADKVGQMLFGSP